jgi:hypothetical protein
MAADNPLTRLDRLVGGEWHYAEGSIENPPVKFHTYRWGLPGGTIISNSFSSEDQQVAQALWYWHPGARMLRALGVTHLEAALSLFNYISIQVTEETMTCKVEAQTGGEVERYAEEWRFSGKDEYHWNILPLWYHLIFLLLLIPGVLVGAALF